MKTIKIPLDKICLTKSFNLKGEYVRDRSDDKGYWHMAILRVGNLNYAGFTIGLVPEGYMSRLVDQGPLVPGPSAYAFANASVLDNHGGTGAELRKAESESRVFHAEIGDVLDLGGVFFRIDPANNRNIDLVKVDKPPQVNKTVILTVEITAQIPGDATIDDLYAKIATILIYSEDKPIAISESYRTTDAAFAEETPE